MRTRLSLAILLLTLNAPLFAIAETPPTPQTCFKDSCIDVEVVTTPKDMERGLQGRLALGENHGMLFIFRMDGIYPFWMKDMKIPLDMLWLDNAGKLVHISRNVPTCTKDPCLVYGTEQPIRYVLEVESGFAAAHALKAGDTARFNFPNPGG
jgi:uncharacterized membrane protein (UPF0127 family)